MEPFDGGQSHGGVFLSFTVRCYLRCHPGDVSPNMLRGSPSGHVLVHRSANLSPAAAEVLARLIKARTGRRRQLTAVRRARGSTSSQVIGTTDMCKCMERSKNYGRHPNYCKLSILVRNAESTSEFSGDVTTLQCREQELGARA